MIASFRHKGLERLYVENDGRRLPPDMVERIRLVLSALDVAEVISELDLPTFRLHPLKGDLRGRWAIVVRANWRIVFRFKDGTATEVDFVDYH